MASATGQHGLTKVWTLREAMSSDDLGKLPGRGSGRCLDLTHPQSRPVGSAPDWSPTLDLKQPGMFSVVLFWKTTTETKFLLQERDKQAPGKTGQVCDPSC